MGRYISDANIVGFQYESGLYASPTGTTLQPIGLVQNHEPIPSQGTRYVRYNASATRNQNIAVPGAETYEGNINYYPQDWRQLLFALGSCVDTSGLVSTHVISELNSTGAYAFTSGPFNPFASFTVYDAQQAPGTGQNLIRQYNGAIVNTWEMAWGEGNIVECTTNYIAQAEQFASGTPTSVTIASNDPFIWSQVTVSIPSGTVLQNVKSGKFMINNNLERRQYANGSRVTEVPVPLNRDYSLELTLDGMSETTKTYYNQYFKGGSEFNMTIFVADVTSAGVGSRDCVFVLSGCTVDPINAATGNSEVQTNEQKLTIVPRSCIVTVHDTIAKYNPY